MSTYLDFEKPIESLDARILELRSLNEDAPSESLLEEISNVEKDINNAYQKIFSNITPWQRTLIARHPDRPKTKNYIENLIEDFFPLSGDRLFSDDKAIIGGFGKFRGKSVLILGHEKGHDTSSRIEHNFGMPRPEGYRKAQRLIKFAEKFSLPVFTFIDTAGAYPGKGAEERGQAEAIAQCIKTSLNASVPIISTITGEGGSGGAVALATASKVLMLEHSIYSVISPEGCSSILWRSSENYEQAANALKLTAQDLLKLKVIDEIIPEPIGAAHRDPETVISTLGESLKSNLKKVMQFTGSELMSSRKERFINL